MFDIYHLLITVHGLVAIIAVIALAIMLIYADEIKEDRLDLFLTFEIKIFGTLSILSSLDLIVTVTSPYIFIDVGYMWRAAYILIAIVWMTFGIGVLRKLPGARIGLIIISAFSTIEDILPPSYIISAIKQHEIYALSTLSAEIMFYLATIFFFTHLKVKRLFEQKPSRWGFRF